MKNYDLAFRMQTGVPGVIDLANASPKTEEMYGLDDANKKFLGGNA